MSGPPIEAFVGGALTSGFLMVALFFLRFWGRTRDGLFLAFAGAFALLALGQGLAALLGLPEAGRAGIYLLRLAAFSLIIAAILAKNLRRRQRRQRRF